MRNLLWPMVLASKAGACQIVSVATILIQCSPTSTRVDTNLVMAVPGATGAPRRTKRTAANNIPAPKARLNLLRFVPFRLSRLAAEVSSALSAEYQARYG